MADLTAALQYEADTEKEWGKYVAVGPIYYDGVLAYVKGQPVPVSNVEQYKYDEQGLVAKTTTKAGQAALTGEGA